MKIAYRIFKDSIENTAPLNLNAVPSVFRQMVHRDLEKFKNKNGFQDFFIKETKAIVNKLPPDSVAAKGISIRYFMQLVIKRFSLLSDKISFCYWH